MFTKPLTERIELAAPTIDGLVRRAEGKNPQIVRIRDEFFGVCDKFGLSTTQIMNCGKVGFHPLNRGTSGIEPQNLPMKVKTFTAGGWSMFEVSRACCVEREPGEVGDNMEAENRRVSIQSNGMLAPVLPGSLQVFSLTVGHTAQAARAVLFECSCNDKDLGENGKYSKHKVVGDDPKMQEALDIGWSWRVIAWQVAKRWPTLMELIIESDNVPGQAVKQDSLLELTWKTYRACKQHVDTQTKKVDIEKVTATLRRSEVHSGALDDILSFVVGSCGTLEDPFVLHDLDGFLKTLNVVKDPNAQVLGKVGKADLGPTGCPWWRGCCYKAMAVSGNATKPYLVVTDVAPWQKILKTIIQADNMMQQARKLADRCPDLPTSKRSILLGYLDLRAFAHVNKRPLAFVPGTFKSLSQIGATFFAELCEACKTAELPLPKGNPWKDEEVIEAASKSGGSGLDVPSLRPGGSAAQSREYLVTKGFTLDTEVKAKDDKDGNEIWKLAAVQRDTVTLKKGTVSKSCSLDKFLDTYQPKITDKRDSIYIHTTLPPMVSFPTFNPFLYPIVFSVSA